MIPQQADKHLSWIKYRIGLRKSNIVLDSNGSGLIGPDPFFMVKLPDGYRR